MSVEPKVLLEPPRNLPEALRRRISILTQYADVLSPKCVETLGDLFPSAGRSVESRHRALVIIFRL